VDKREWEAGFYPQMCGETCGRKTTSGGGGKSGVSPDARMGGSYPLIHRLYCQYYIYILFIKKDIDGVKPKQRNLSKETRMVKMIRYMADCNLVCRGPGSSCLI